MPDLTPPAKCPTCGHTHPSGVGARWCACADCGLLWTTIPQVDPTRSPQEALVLEHVIRYVRAAEQHTPAFGARGQIIAVVDLVGEHACDGSCSPWAVPGAHHLELANPRVLGTPLVAVGHLWMWDPGNLLTSLIAEQVTL